MDKEKKQQTGGDFNNKEFFFFGKPFSYWTNFCNPDSYKNPNKENRYCSFPFNFCGWNFREKETTK